MTNTPEPGSKEDMQQCASWISKLVLDICPEPALTSCRSIMDDNGLLITVYVPKGHLGFLVGHKGLNAQTMRQVAHMYGRKYKVHASLKFEEAV